MIDYSIPFTKTPDGVFFIIDNSPKNMSATHEDFEAVIAALNNNDVDELRKLIDKKTAVSNVTNGRVVVTGNSVSYRSEDGEEVSLPVYVAQRILEIQEAGEDVTSMLRFAEKLMKNPNEEIREDLLKWLERSKMPIYKDGDFSAFKKVKEDYKSYRVGYGGIVVINTIGSIIEMNRNDCNPRRTDTCSTGLHFCSFAYLPEYFGNTGRVVILKINPEDVVAIPTDYNLAKGRACRYEIIGEVSNEEAAFAFNGHSVVGAFGTYQDDEQPDVDQWDTDTSSWDEEEEEEEVNTAVAYNTTEESSLSFTNKAGKTYSGHLIKFKVDSLGITNASMNLNVPRSTLSRWYKKVKEHLAKNDDFVVNGKTITRREVRVALENYSTRSEQALELGISVSTLGRLLKKMN